ncbi:MAG: hypothetical protein GY807_24735 [Gammaproteobacteria bacterium]|nr:hypothetical protein [Gammaproteobacteria bacterium]
MRVEQSTLFQLRWLLAALLSASLAVWATIWCLADIFQSNGIAMLYAGLESSASQEQWDRGWTRLGDARELNPLNAEYPFYQAYFSHNRAQGASEQRGELPDFRNQTFDYFNQALRLRPHWGYVWAQRAEVGLANGEGSEGTFIALGKALEFAPYEPFVLHIALRVGFNFWDHLDDGVRQKLLSAVRYLLRHDPRFVVETALLFEWTEQLRPLLSDDRDIEHLNRRLTE